MREGSVPRQGYRYHTSTTTNNTSAQTKQPPEQTNWTEYYATHSPRTAAALLFA